METRYRNGQVALITEKGIRTYYYSDGGLRAAGPFDGKFQGEWKFYRKTGQLWVVGHFRDDLKDGVWLTYDRGLKLIKTQLFTRDKEQKKH